MAVESAKHRSILRPIVVVFGSVILFAYAVIAVMSSDPVWFQNRAVLPDPVQIVARFCQQHECRIAFFSPISPDKRVRLMPVSNRFQMLDIHDLTDSSGID